MNILVAISDQYFARAILAFMKSWQWKAGSFIGLLHVLDPAPGAVEKREGSIVEDGHPCQVKLLEDFALELKRLNPDLEIEKSLESGKIGTAAEVILQCAEKWSADMIIMGSHGRKGLERLLLGSVAMAVTAGASCSVAIVKPLQARSLDLTLSEEDLPQQICSINMGAAKSSLSVE
jgi:nucleotide-binding universal stress UspA family protein